MQRRLMIVSAVIAAALATATGCNQQPGQVAASPKNENGQPDNNINIGAALFPVRDLPPAPRPVSTAATESMLVPAHTLIISHVDLPSQRDGRILFIGTKVKPGDRPIDPSRLYKHRDVVYRPLEAGDRVEKGDVVMLLDDAEAWAKLEASRVAAEAAKKILTKAVLVRKEAWELQQKRKELYDKGSLAPIEFIQGNIEYARAEATEASQEADLEKAQQEYVAAQLNYNYFTIRSSTTGIVLPFNQRAGQAVKALESVLQVQDTDTLRAEGMMALGFAGRLQRGMRVLVEPTVEEAPSFHRRFHSQAIHGVAVSNHERQPFVVSVGEDRTARVWDGRSNYETAIFHHPAAVRCVACSPPGSNKHYCLTGAEDGKARLWDLSVPKSTRTPVRELEHKGVIFAVAFSPDGKTCATADSRDIILWDVESGALKYKLPQYHLGDITSLTFTPQAKLVSASRDSTVRVWSLGQDGGRLESTQDGRSGDVGRLGVSADGRYFLLDIGQSLRLMSTGELRTEGIIEGVNETSKFGSFALFSPDSQLVLTGNQNESRVSLWRAPLGGSRATEVRHFVPRERMVNFTCAAISPFRNEPFAVTGTKNGDVYLWPMPTDKQLARIPGELTFIDPNSAAATRQVRIWADFPNDKANSLIVGTNVTIVIEPAGAK